MNVRISGEAAVVATNEERNKCANLIVEDLVVVHSAQGVILGDRVRHEVLVDLGDFANREGDVLGDAEERLSIVSSSTNAQEALWYRNSTRISLDHVYTNQYSANHAIFLDANANSDNTQ